MKVDADSCRLTTTRSPGAVEQGVEHGHGALARHAVQAVDALDQQLVGQ